MSICSSDPLASQLGCCAGSKRWARSVGGHAEPRSARRRARRGTAARHAALGEPALRDHAVEHAVPPLGGAFGVHRGVHRDGDWISAASIAPSATVRCCRRACRSTPGRRLDAVGAAAEVDGVQVVAEHLVLRLLLEILTEMTSSLDLRHSETCSSPTNAFLTYCWVIVEPPPSPPKMLFLNARAKPTGEARVGVEAAVLRGQHRV